MQLILLFFFVVGLAVYGGSLRNPFISVDDPLLITENLDVQSISAETLKSIFSRFDPELYMPFTFLAYQLQYAFSGPHPFTFHLVSLLMHIVNAFLVYVLLGKLTKAPQLSLFAGLLFLVHPLHTEAVVWASAQKDLLSAFFFLASLLAYLSFAETERRKKYYGSLLLFLCGLFSKPTVLLLPFIFLLTDFWNRRKWGPALFIEKIPFFLLSVAFGIVGLIGKVQTVEAGSFGESLLTGARGSLMLLRRMVWPRPLSIIYPYTEHIGFLSPGFVLPLLFILLLLVFAWRKRREVPALFVGVVWFFLLVAPSSLNVRKGENFGDLVLTSDRYAYLASIGILLLFIVAVQPVYERILQKHNGRKILAVFSAATIAFFGVLTLQYGSQWRSERTLFNHVIRYEPNARFAYKILGDGFRERGLLKEAIESYTAALAIRPTGRVYIQLGQTYLDSGKLEEAVEALTKSLEFNPLHAGVYLNIGVAYTRMGRWDDAVAAFKRSAELDPSSPIPQKNIEAVQYRQLLEKLGG